MLVFAVELKAATARSGPGCMLIARKKTIKIWIRKRERDRERERERQRERQREIETETDRQTEGGRART